MEWTGIWRLVLFDVVNWFPGCLKDMIWVGIKKKKTDDSLGCCMHVPRVNEFEIKRAMLYLNKLRHT